MPWGRSPVDASTAAEYRVDLSELQRPVTATPDANVDEARITVLNDVDITGATFIGADLRDLESNSLIGTAQTGLQPLKAGMRRRTQRLLRPRSRLL